MTPAYEELHKKVVARGMGDASVRSHYTFVEVAPKPNWRRRISALLTTALIFGTLYLAVEYARVSGGL